MTRATFTRQFTATLIKHRKQLTRHTIHLVNFLLNFLPSILLAWYAGRDSNVEFPSLTSCGMVDPNALVDYGLDIPMTLNEAWRNSLPVYLMTLGPTLSSISVFLIVRDELTSRRWGMLRSAGLRDSVHWITWFISFAFLGLVNSLLGATTAALLPNSHPLESVNFASVFGTLLFLNLALTASSFFLAACCGSVESTTLTVFVIMGIICAGSVPAIATWSQVSAYDSIDTYNLPYGDGGAFVAYGSTSRSTGSYNNVTFELEPSSTECELPLLSYEEGHKMKTAQERNEVSKDDIFLGCYIIPGASTSFRKESSFFFWYLIPQTHFIMAWSNILGYTALPGNVFTFSEASKSPEALAKEALLNYRSENEVMTPDLAYDNSSLPTIMTDVNYVFPSDAEPLSNCPSSEVVSNLCNDYELSSCSFMELGYPSASSPSLNESIGLLISLVVLYCMSALYIGAVFSMGNGSAMKFYFPFQLRFWFQSFGKNDGGYSNDIEERGHHCEEPEDVGVEAIEVRKSFGKVEALKPLSMKLNVGEVTSLLGHNGAGKSTFVNILCCEQNASNGDILVLGKSVKTDPNHARSLLGECKQDDYLWSELSAKDHLELFAGIRGLDLDKASSTVQSWLESVGLEIVQNDRTSSFSGGMKRRLSVAIATIGPSKLIVLDEPTTGMDPISRRLVWNHIIAIKPGRVILLTTHAMEEADLLSDSVAIMCGGRLVAKGSPLELKSQYGSAVQFSLIVDKIHVQTVDEHTKRHFETSLDWISLESSDSGYMTLTIQKIQRKNEEVGVEASSVSTFIEWLEQDDSPVKDFTISNSSLEEVFMTVTKSHHSESSSASQNQKSKSCCWYRRNDPNRTSAEEPTPTDEVMIIGNLHAKPKAELTDFSRNLSLKNQTIALFRFFLERTWTSRSSVMNWALCGIFCAGNMITGFGMVTFWPQYAMYYLLLVTAILVILIAPVYSDRKLGLFQMMRTQSMLNKSFILGTCFYSWTVSFVYVLVILTLFFASNIYRDAVTNSDCTGSQDDGCGYPYFGSVPIVNEWNRVPVLYGEFNGSDVTVYAHQGSGGYEMIVGIIIVFSLTFPGSVLSSSLLPGFRLPLVGVSVILLVACISPGVLFTFYYPEYCTKLFDETMDNCSQYFFDLENVNSTFVECVGFQLTTPQIYCSPAHLSILPQIGLFQLLSLTLTANVVFYSEPEEYAEEVLIPNLEDASCSENSCSYHYAQKQYMHSLGYMILGGFLLLIVGIGFAYINLYPLNLGKLVNKHTCTSHGAVYILEDEELDEVDSERNFVASVINPILTKRGEDEPADSSSPVVSPHARDCIQGQLPPVIMHQLRKVYPLSGKPIEKVALECLDLHVPYGQVLGLLGRNGAGKTTALKILTGMDDASFGVALAAGYDVKTERQLVSERLGNCPQFDCIWKNQSVRSHLEFYARLKGVEKPVTAAKEIAVAVGLGDPDVYSRLSGQLSGGMRRRLSIAISLVGSPDVLCLDEPTTGLDPSTRHDIWGLISSFSTPERAVIITTHSMVEADALCSRIAIVSKGRLKVVGTQQHLKARLDNYGSGYLVQLNLVRNSDEAVDVALNFVKEHVHEDARIVVRQAKTVGINLPRELSMCKVFTKMYSEGASEAGINQFLVSQSSLEDVFVSLG